MRTQHTLYTQIKQYLAFFVVTFCFVPFAFSAESCDQGQYLEKGKCNKCYTTEFYKRFHGYVCPGSWEGNARVSGLEACGDDTVPDETQHTCNKLSGKDVFLKPGQYFDGDVIDNCTKENMEKLLNLYGPDGPARHSIGDGSYFLHDESDKDSYSFYCPGGTFRVDDVRHHPKGFKACPDSGYAYDKDFYYSFCESGLPGTVQLTCEAGEFIPKNSTQCQSCKIVHYGNWDRTPADTGLSKNRSCMKGFTATAPFGASQFADTRNLKDVCPEGAGFNEDNSKCMEKGIEVAPLSSSSNTSNTSTNNQVDVRVYPGLGNISGPEINYQAPETLNIKTLQSIKCKKGEVWFNQQCTPCASRVIWKNYAQEHRFYCPGGEWAVGTPLLNQLRRCPRAAWPNDNLTDCNCKWGKNVSDTIDGPTTKCADVQLTNDDLYYGPKGKDAPEHKQCWSKTTEAAYKECMGFDN